MPEMIVLSTVMIAAAYGSALTGADGPAEWAPWAFALGVPGAIVAVILAAAVVGFALEAQAIDITGAGATFPAPLYAKWAADYNKATGIKIEYITVTTDDVTKRVITQPNSFDVLDTEYFSLKKLVPSGNIFALDAKKQQDPVWKPIFDNFKPVQQWLADKKPDECPDDKVVPSLLAVVFGTSMSMHDERDAGTLEWLISECVRVKASVVGADERVGRGGRAGNVDAVAAPLIGDRAGSERADDH